MTKDVFKSKFSTLVNEEILTDYNGISVFGDFVHLFVQKAKNNDTMGIVINGTKHLSKMKSAESIKSEYAEKDWITIEKMWTNVAKKYESKISSIVQNFEKELIKITDDMTKDIKNIE